MPAQLLELRTKENRPEDEEGGAVERGPRHLGEEHRLGHLILGEEAKESAGHERGDEPGPSECVGRSVGGNGRGQGNDLPGLVDQISPTSENDDSGGKLGHADTTEEALTDLFGHHGKRMSPSPSARGCGEKDQQQRHADPVVEAALEVQRLTDDLRRPLISDDGASESTKEGILNVC